MSENNVYYGKGTYEMFDEYVDFINYVFGFNGNSSDFKKLLPKLYKREYNPAGNSYVAVEDGKIRAAIGAYDHDIVVCGDYIKTRGIGNVAVHPYTRSRGYMVKLMNSAIDDMVKDGVALSALGGRRQRYNYFSFDKCGSQVVLSINSDNIRHTFGSERTHKIKFEKVTADNKDALEKIRLLSESYPLHAVREPQKYYEIITSWRYQPYAAYLDGEFIGYCVVIDETVSEFLVSPNTTDILPEFVCTLFDFLKRGKLVLKIPMYLNEYIKQLVRIGEFYDIEPPKSFSVLNYKTVVGAFMKLKATYSHLPDGEITFRINGRGGVENITLSVKDNNAAVNYTDKEPAFTLEHLEAMNLLFAPVCPAREDLPDFAKMWLPLPLFIYYADTV